MHAALALCLRGPPPKPLPPIYLHARTPPTHPSRPHTCPRRHIFESKKYVEEYRSEDVQSELGVGREELARLAQLLGGDYCKGVAGEASAQAFKPDAASSLNSSCGTCCRAGARARVLHGHR